MKIERKECHCELGECWGHPSRLEDVIFWVTIIVATLAVVIFIGEVTGVVDSFINSFAN